MNGEELTMAFHVGHSANIVIGFFLLSVPTLKISLERIPEQTLSWNSIFP